jgi:uncharacterized membrane protein YgdD (TMEM256/DUF423 family)
MSYGVLGAISAFIAVLAGAFGAHALRATLAPDLLQVFETGARYQLFHALALILVGLALGRTPRRALRAAGALFVAGTVLFSGSLYALALTGVRALGAITPLGGLCLLAGWIAMALGLSRVPEPGA